MMVQVEPDRIEEAFPNIADYGSKVPALLVLEIVCLVILILDVVYTGVRCKLNRPKAPDFPEFLLQRVSMLLMMLLAAVLEPIVPTIPLLGLASVYYAFFCARHIVLSARQDDVPIPDILANALGSKEPATPDHP